MAKQRNGIDWNAAQKAAQKSAAAAGADEAGKPPKLPKPSPASDVTAFPGEGPNPHPLGERVLTGESEPPQKLTMAERVRKRRDDLGEQVRGQRQNVMDGVQRARNRTMGIEEPTQALPQGGSSSGQSEGEKLLERMDQMLRLLLAMAQRIDRLGEP